MGDIEVDPAVRDTEAGRALERPLFDQLEGHSLLLFHPQASCFPEAELISGRGKQGERARGREVEKNQ